MTELGRHRFEQRIATIAKVLDAVGEVTVTDDTRRRGRARHLVFEVDAPGERRLQSRFRYEEWWDRWRIRYRLTRYHYGYWDRTRGGMLAYHWHAIRGRTAVHHAHCQPAERDSASPHFRYYEVSLLEAHEEFARLYALDEPIDCSGFRPLLGSSVER